MTDFKYKPGDKKNLKTAGSDPMLELTRLLGRNNLTSVQRVNNSPSSMQVEDDQYGVDPNVEEANSYNSPPYSSVTFRQNSGLAYEENHQVDSSEVENTYWTNSQDGFPKIASAPDDGRVDDNYAYSNDKDFVGEQSPEFYEDEVYSAHKRHSPNWRHNGGVSSANIQPSQQNEFPQDELINEETLYWTNVVDEPQSYDSEYVEGQQWSEPFDNAEQFVDANYVGRNECNQDLLHNKPVNDQISHGSPQWIKDDLPSEDRRGAQAPQFVDNLSQNKNISSRGVSENLEFSDKSETKYNQLSFDQVKKLGAVIEPIHMATKSQSFLGYGQAVAVLPTGQKAKKNSTHGVEDKAGFSLSRSNLVAANKYHDRNSFVSGNAPIGRGINPFTVDQKNVNTSEVPINSDFEDALNDFNLTIKGDDKRRYKRDPNLKTIRPDKDSVPHTQSFDLPNVGYNDESVLANQYNDLDQELSVALSAGVNDSEVLPYRDPSAVNTVIRGDEIEVAQVSRFTDAQNSHSDAAGFNDVGVDVSKYDWSEENGRAVNVVQKSGVIKKILFLSVLIALICAGLGIYYAFFSGSEKVTQPVVIHRDAGDVRVEPENTANTSDANSEPAIYGRVENGTNRQVLQRELVDKSEAPVDLDIVEGLALGEREFSLDKNSVESHVLKAVKNSLVIHEVPTITIKDKKNITGDDINSIIANNKDDILAPGETFKEYLQNHNQDQQILPDDSFLTDYINGDSGSAHNGDSNSTSDGADISSLLGSDETHAMDYNTSTENSQISGSQSQNSHANNGSLLGNSENAHSDNSYVDNLNGGSASQIATSSTLPENRSLQTENTSLAPIENRGTTNSSVTNNSSQAQSVQVTTGLPAGTHYVQVASQPNREAAQQSLVDLKRQSQVSLAFGERQVVIVAADIPGRGTYYRVRVVANSHAEANQFCEQLKGLQVECFVGQQL